MSLQVWPTTPPPSFSYPVSEEYETIVSQFGGPNEAAQSLTRFPKRNFTVGYNLLDIGGDWHYIHDFHTKRRGQYETFWYFDFYIRPWVDLYVGRGDGSTTAFDLHSKSTVHDASLKIYVNDAEKTEGVDYDFSAGTGDGGADRITFRAGHIPAAGALITSDLQGKLRIKARKADLFSDKVTLENDASHAFADIEAFLIREVQW